ncbi:three-Cys-motif partner protein TcmP [Kaistia nematophila]|uniref:Three-Cys-motif partner protein TcmP n=1 Tax=Kaistia nematophila TaxID=2994654 RepID=A0A9X3E0T1_9HYPH|nr:three-Cys-motif partner protein TcmP [Kaistia nematophila]MCX5569636.1 three-Cys-motif partner protein TcmP [Kaistia nematophila]
MADATTLAVQHEFGSQHTELKLSIVEGYLQLYTKALRSRWPALWYIDAFAGTGSRTVRVAARDGTLFEEPVAEMIEERRGSARIALEVQPHFDRLVFMEQNPLHCQALEALKADFPGRQIDILQGDANELIRSEIDWDGWRKTRAVMFIDPYGMEVDWTTLKAIADTRAIDVWYLFSLSGLFRQAARKVSSIDASKRAAITRMLGTDEWEKELYAPPPQRDLLSILDEPEVAQRLADVKSLEAYVKRRLETLFPLVLEPFPLPLDRGPQRFSLFMAVANKEPKAIALARRLGNHVLNSGKKSQVRP